METILFSLPLELAKIALSALLDYWSQLERDSLVALYFFLFLLSERLYLIGDYPFIINVAKPFQSLAPYSLALINT